MNKQNMRMLNRYLDRDKSEKQFDKKCVTLEGTEKTFEYVMKGSGEPTIVLINGAGGPIEGWMKCWPLLEGSFTVFAYNRLGIDGSSAPTEPQNAIQMAKDLRQLLESVGLKPPFLLVGHSLGGFIAHVYASMAAHDIIGVLFIESSTIEDVEGSTNQHRKMVSKGPYNEVHCVKESVDQIKNMPHFPQIPLAVIAGFHPMAKMFFPKGRFLKRFENQRKLLNLSSDSQLIVAAKSGHFPQMSEPKLVVDAIRQLMT